MLAFCACCALLTFALSSGARAAATPAWLALAPGTLARVDIAPWLVSDEPEAALTESAASLEHDFTTHGERPGDIVFEPIGVRVRVVRVLPGGRVALVRGRDARFVAYTLVARLVPEIPPGTALRAAGGFQGYSDFFASVSTPYAQARRLETGSALVALGTGAGAYDPETSDLVRVRVRVLSGALRGRTGWVAVAYTGVPSARLPATADVAERACTCRIVAFGS
ncbi:MAG: hypothetical protein NVS2B3_09620 [Vulcanimicrobiaceae bacterium]